ncbi:glycoside hydrolase family 3 N-terminal domain-containing protein [Pleomorphochaeta sp. DL1XJH-081]|uniref:glycoside hydrolase family 3 N-terminal domain-containing protein n=1 Tax=Pleomorphochaeta sp. DL1XJH-081 TaxID=3409690 RepID=UPI003BB71CAB
MHSNRERALELLRKMTLEEKVAQLCSAWLEISSDGSFTVKEIAFTKDRPDQDREMVLGEGIGQLTRPFGTHAVHPREIAKGINEIQRYLIGRTRLGIPAMLHEECLTGAMVPGATIFPSSLNQGSVWDPALMRKVAQVIGKEMSTLGVHQGLAPVLDVARDARWGRLEETFSEDPYLVGCLGTAYVQGLQGDKQSPIATLKHFMGHSFSEGGRNHAPVHIGQRELLNVFGLPFEMVIKLAKPGAVMPAYHDIDGEPCSGSRSMITDLLKRTWGFNGLVVADYEAPIQLFNDHHVAMDIAEAAAMAVHAGMDLELPSSTCFKHGLVDAVQRNIIDIDEINVSVMKILVEKFRQGIFDHPFIESDAIELNSSEHHDLAIEVAQKSFVLLRNDGILPLAKDTKVALVGPLADNAYAMYNGYSVPIHLQGVSGDEDIIPKRAKTIREGIQSLVGTSLISYADGCVLFEQSFGKAVFFPGDVTDKQGDANQAVSSDTGKIKEAVALAKKSDVVIAVVGDMVGLFQHGTVGEGSDTTSLQLPGVQQTMINALLDTGKPVVVILVSGRPYHLGRATTEAAAIIAAWLPGEGGGEAIANILYGIANPGGRTPLSFPKVGGAMPYAYNHVKKATGMPKQREFGAQYPFGHGLSYTNFSYSDFGIASTTAPVDGEFVVSVTITNTGSLPGDEVVQLYVKDDCSSIVRPGLELKGFCRVSLDPGKKARVHFNLPTDVLSFLLDKDTRVIEPGTFTLSIGRSSENLEWTRQIEILGDRYTLEREWRMQTKVGIEPIA